MDSRDMQIEIYCMVVTESLYVSSVVGVVCYCYFSYNFSHFFASVYTLCVLYE